MKKPLLILFLLIGIIYPHSDALAADDIRIIKLYSRVETENVYMRADYIPMDTKPVNINGYILVPIRFVAEALNYEVNWDQARQIIIVSYNDKSLQFEIGSYVVMGNMISKDIPIAPQIIDNRTMVPLRIVEEFFDQHVYWERVAEMQIQYIWISPYQLLEDKDVIVTNNNNYLKCRYDAGDLAEPPYYKLKENKQTARGIQLGDYYEEVIEAYGAAHSIRHRDEYTDLIYTTPLIPNTDIGTSVLFVLKNGIIIDVEVHGDACEN